MLEYLTNAAHLRQRQGRYEIDPVTAQVKVVGGQDPRWKDPKPLPTRALALRSYKLVSGLLNMSLNMTAVLRSDGLEYDVRGRLRGPRRCYLAKDD